MLTSLGVDFPTAVLLGLALALALSFEFVNGFHDTANAVATVIYTHSLKPTQAVVWSGAWNLIGVLTSSGAVAFGIVALLPVELVINVGSGAGFAMVFSLLVSAIIWNVGTWYLGLPASSSHTLIGSIVGVGLMNSWLTPDTAFGEGVNWAKVEDTVKALLFSPIIGFVGAGVLVWVARRALARYPQLFHAPVGEQPPPVWVRALLILTCTGVSFAHGSNDGQKGQGLIVLILVGIVPAVFALDLKASAETLQGLEARAVALTRTLPPPPEERIPSAPPEKVEKPKTQLGELERQETQPRDPTTAELTRYLRTGKRAAGTYPALALSNGRLAARMKDVNSLQNVPREQRTALRLDIYLVSETLAKLAKSKELPPSVPAADTAAYVKQLRGLTNYIPIWVKIAVALALGLGTMIGWKRIVVTVGEKIGKAHLTYAQGASAELVAFGTIEAADQLGLPVSTTHILSSGIAGTMVANGAGIQKDTVRNIILAWVLTLPVCVTLGAALFAAGLFFVFRVLGAV